MRGRSDHLVGNMHIAIRDPDAAAQIVSMIHVKAIEVGHELVTIIAAEDRCTAQRSKNGGWGGGDREPPQQARKERLRGREGKKLWCILLPATRMHAPARIGHPHARGIQRATECGGSLLRFVQPAGAVRPAWARHFRRRHPFGVWPGGGGGSRRHSPTSIIRAAQYEDQETPPSANW